MLKTVPVGIIRIAALALLAVTVLEAQQPKEQPPAPVPVQITSAKKVFISNASGDGAVPAGASDPLTYYNGFYAAMKSWGRYELVSAPADADLILEIRVAAAVGWVTGGDSRECSQLRLVILEPKTHVVLWAFTENTVVALLESNRRKDFDHAIAKIVDDVKSIATPPPAAAEGAKQ